ncbi:MAG: hypothetical protein WD894_24555 [Pirellulales bacterium]
MSKDTKQNLGIVACATFLLVGGAYLYHLRKVGAEARGAVGHVAHQITESKYEVRNRDGREEGYAGATRKEMEGMRTAKPGLPNERIQCDRFSLVTEVADSTIDLALSTDLPNDTIVMVSVSRSYWEKGSAVEYSVDYFSQRSTVGSWRSKREIVVADEVWWSALREMQAKMARVGLGFEVASVSDEIEIRMVVPINQPNARFGERNQNLVGKAVRTTGLRVIEDETKILRPIIRTTRL